MVRIFGTCGKQEMQLRQSTKFFVRNIFQVIIYSTTHAVVVLILIGILRKVGINRPLEIKNCILGKPGLGEEIPMEFGN